MKYVCTWLCTDEAGRNAIFPQATQWSCSQSHPGIYWRCLLLFFIISKRFNKKERHILFTNVGNFPGEDGKWISTILSDLDVEVIIADFKYGLPNNIHDTDQNQFYELSILEYILQNDFNRRDRYVVLNSDRIFSSVRNLFKDISFSNFISFDDNVPAGYGISRLNKKDLKAIYSNLLEYKVNGIFYYPTEFLSRSMERLEKIVNGFSELATRVFQWNKRAEKKT